MTIENLDTLEDRLRDAIRCEPFGSQLLRESLEAILYFRAEFEKAQRGLAILEMRIDSLARAIDDFDPRKH